MTASAARDRLRAEAYAYADGARDDRDEYLIEAARQFVEAERRELDAALAAKLAETKARG